MTSRPVAEFRLPDRYSEKFGQMLQSISEKAAQSRNVANRPFTAFWPMRGRRFVEGEGLMVIGRAVNGWSEETWTPSEIADQSKREQLSNALRDLSENTSADRWKYSHDRVINIHRGIEIEKSKYSCPLSWVVENAATKKNKENAGPKANYNTNRSAFWRVTRSVLQACYPQSEDSPSWSSHLCWSNLYKSASAKQGNPSTQLKNAQQRACIELLEIELDTWNPKRVLVLAGAKWFVEPFADGLQVEFDILTPGSLVEKVGYRDGQRWVVAKHPMRKPEGEMTRLVAEAFSC